MSGNRTMQKADLVVAGAGSVGLILAIALARSGFSVVSLGSPPLERNGRTVALLDGSVRMLQALGVWPALADRGAPLATMRIVDGTGSVFRGPPLEFHSSEIGLPAFGYNVENADLVSVLANHAAVTAGLIRSPALLAEWKAHAASVEARTTQDTRIEARLMIAADGARSPTRRAAGLQTRRFAYPQTALTAILHHSEPHQSVSTEFHTRQGPFTLVPLPGKDEAPNRSSLVWVMAPEEADRRFALDPVAFAREIETQSRLLLGSIAVQGTIGRFPISRMVAKQLVGPRLALAGEAAHALPPIGAQGLNLSLRDAATLVDELAQARAAGIDPGSARVLQRYERSRSGDVALRTTGVDMLNRALLSSLLPVDAFRGAGMLALSTLPSVRRALMRQGLMPQHAVPSLMR